VDVNFTIEAINTAELAELNQELFDKLFGAIATEELKAKLKKMLNLNLSDQNISDVTEFLIESTKFDLPAEFLKNGCKPLGRKIIS
jgi:trigger factor